MPDETEPASLLEQLDSMQDYVIGELDALDERILGLIKECTVGPDRGLSVVGGEEDLPEAA